MANATELTWAVLLGRWVDFARSAVALPREGRGAQLRESVPDIIMLQAVWFALGHIEELGAAERSLGLDRAEVLIEKHNAVLCARWLGPGGGELPGQLAELIADARAAARRERRRTGK